MTPERYDALCDNDKLPLTQQEAREGWHFCPDWDFLLIGPGMKEVEACSCPPCE